MQGTALVAELDRAGLPVPVLHPRSAGVARFAVR
jgi:hypothetical protein